MLNIPETIKTLFKDDGVYKNLRIKFKSGIHPDLTNENISRESMRCTESICSRDVLRFGLTEASVFEFEAIDIPNIYGETIEALTEIDTSSLTDSELDEIEAGSWDGQLVRREDSTLSRRGSVTTGSGSGDTVQISNQGGTWLSSLEADIVAKQSGSGTPSPDNYRPITGYASAEITAGPARTIIPLSADPIFAGHVDLLGGTGTVTQRAAVFYGAEDWQTVRGIFYLDVDFPYLKTANFTPTADRLEGFESQTNTTNAAANMTEDSVCWNRNNSYNRVFVKASRFADVPAFKAWLSVNPLTVTYVLATTEAITFEPGPVALPVGLLDVASDTGTITAASWSDAVGYFSVPYGTFRVESCPRDHRAMARRRVTAYTVIGRKTTDNPFEAAKSALMLTGAKTYEPNAQALVLSSLAYLSDSILSDQGYTKAAVTFTPPSSGRWPHYETSVTLKTAGGESWTLYCGIDYKSRAAYPATPGQTLTAPGTIHALDTGGYDFDAVMSTAISTLETMDIDLQASGYASYSELAEALIQGLHVPHIRYDVTDRFAKLQRGFVPTPDSLLAFYAWRSSNPSICLPMNVYFSGDQGPGYWSIVDYPDTITFYEWTPPASPGPLADVKLSFPSTLESVIQTRAGKKRAYSFSSAYSVHDICQGFLELSALYGAPGRDGGYRLLRLSTETPVAIVPGNYSSCWWDEINVEPVGTVRIAFKTATGQEEQETEIQIGPGASVYDMTDNAVLKNMIGASIDSITDIINGNFAPHVSALGFIPIDLEKKGLPYLEAGDFLAVTADDGVTVQSFNMRQTISGIQSLRASVESVSGQIVEEV